MILCDTNILIDFYKAKPSVISNLQQIGANNIAISAITKAELFYGARDKQELNLIAHQLSACHCFELNQTISGLFIELMQRYCLSHKASIPDMLIAATAITQEVELYTQNVKDFRFIPELKLYLGESV